MKPTQKLKVGTNYFAEIGKEWISIKVVGIDGKYCWCAFNDGEERCVKLHSDDILPRPPKFLVKKTLSNEKIEELKKIHPNALFPDTQIIGLTINNVENPTVFSALEIIFSFIKNENEKDLSGSKTV